jgi:uncharacterized PurR-regulated membrane protein YhhQ (DUF165 family)
MKITRAAAPTMFVATVLAANLATSRLGLVPVGFGLTATAGTYAAGLGLAARDWTQEAVGKRAAIAAVVIGAALSAVLADGRIALASGVAFLVSEMADLAVYSPLRSRSMPGAVAASNAVGAVIDTVLFLGIAGFPMTGPGVAGQLVGKGWVTLAAVAVAMLARRKQLPASVPWPGLGAGMTDDEWLTPRCSCGGDCHQIAGRAR